MAGKRTFGKVDRLPSGNYRARYLGPDGKRYSARTASGRPLTFTTVGDANAYLAKVQAAISRETWEPPDKPKPIAVTLRDYAEAWLGTRAVAVRTTEHYRYVLDSHILPTFGDAELGAIDPVAVRAWHARTAPPTVKAHSYGLLRSIMATAVTDGKIPSNPCHIRGAGRAPTTKKIRPATLAEVAALVAALPPRYRMLAQLAAWCSLRFGELAGLQRRDVDLGAGLLYVRRGVVRTKSAGVIEKGPKSEAGLRTVTIPPHILDDLRAHLARHAQPGSTGRVFPGRGGGPLNPSTLNRVFVPAAAKAGRPDLTPHGLRHTGQTWAAANGATLRELMARAGQSTPDAALRYLHEVDGRQAEIAQRLADYATGASNVSTLAGRRRAE